MDVEFEFKEKNGGACVTKLLAPGAVCVVPESLKLFCEGIWPHFGVPL